MSGDLLELEPDDELALEPSLELEPETVAAAAPAADAIAPAGLVEILPADFPLPALIKFVPNVALRAAVTDAATYALSLTVDSPEGVQRADLALTALRGSLKAIDEHFDEPTAIAYLLHKRLTSARAEWQAPGKAANETVGKRIYAEQRRLEQLALEERRRAQAEADRQTREAARREAAEAEKAQAPAPVVQELKRQAESATAPPVAVSTPAPVMQGSSVVTTWKARIVGTPGSDDPNPDIAALSPAQRLHVFELLKAILDGKAPLAAIALDWGYLNKRAKADKSTLQIAGLEAFEEGSVRAKGSRGR